MSVQRKWANLATEGPRSYVLVVFGSVWGYWPQLLISFILQRSSVHKVLTNRAARPSCFWFQRVVLHSSGQPSTLQRFKVQPAKDFSYQGIWKPGSNLHGKNSLQTFCTSAQWHWDCWVSGIYISGDMSCDAFDRDPAVSLRTKCFPFGMLQTSRSHSSLPRKSQVNLARRKKISAKKMCSQMDGLIFYGCRTFLILFCGFHSHNSNGHKIRAPVGRKFQTATAAAKARSKWPQVKTLASVSG